MEIFSIALLLLFIVSFVYSHFTKTKEESFTDVVTQTGGGCFYGIFYIIVFGTLIMMIVASFRT